MFSSFSNGVLVERWVHKWVEKEREKRERERDLKFFQKSVSLTFHPARPKLFGWS